MNKQAQRDIQSKLKIIAHAKQTGSVTATCRYWKISRDTFYRWKRDYNDKGKAGLINSKPCPENPKIRVSPIIEEKILYLRQHYHFEPVRISWYLKRYHNLIVSPSGAYSVLLRNGLNRLPENPKKTSD